jgi:hypothetical protein
MDEEETQKEIARLYRQAFADYGAIALWSSRPVPNPTAADALAITGSLRVEGDMGARRLAEEIERLCRPADEAARRQRGALIERFRKTGTDPYFS